MSPKKNLLITASAIYPEYQELVGKTQLDEGFSPFFFEFLTIYPRESESDTLGTEQTCHRTLARFC